MKNLSQYLVPGLLALIALLLVPQRARSVYSSPVQVVNPSSAPVPTSNNDGRNIVRLVRQGILPDGTPGPLSLPLLDAVTNTEYTVPAGKRLVVDAVSYLYVVPPGEAIFPSLYNGITSTTLPVLPQDTGRTVMAPATAIRDYVDQNQQYFLSLSRSSGSGSATFSVVASGRLVDCTNGGDC